MIIFAGKHYLWHGKSYLVHSTYSDGTCDLIVGNDLKNVAKGELEVVS